MATLDETSWSQTQSVSSRRVPFGWSDVGNKDLSLASSGACGHSLRCANVIRAWSGAVIDRVNHRIIVFGGGHSDYDGNEEYALDFAAQDPSFRKIYGPTVPGNFTCANFSKPVDGHVPEEVCTKGLPALRTQNGACYENPSAVAPNSRHTYAGLTMIDSLANGHPGMLAVGGSFACGSGSGDQNDAWLQDLSTGVWQHLTVPTPWRASLGSVVADFDSRSQQVYLASDTHFGAFDYKRSTYKDLNSDFAGAIHDFGAVDRGSHEFVLFEPRIGRIWTFSLNSGKQRDLTATATGCRALISESSANGEISPAYSGIAWDELDQSLVIWPNAGGKIYVYKHGNCKVEDYAAVGLPPADSAHAGAPHTSNGTNGRWQNIGPGLFVLINDWNLPPKFLCRKQSGCELPLD